MDEERMRPDHWLGAVLCVPFCASDTVGWVVIWASGTLKPMPLIKDFLPEMWRFYDDVLLTYLLT